MIVNLMHFIANLRLYEVMAVLIPLIGIVACWSDIQADFKGEQE